MEITNHNNPYEFYSCNYGHSLQWCGNNLYTSTKCCTCKKNYLDNQKSVIRWRCKTCITEYCQACIKILKCKRCPVNHEYKRGSIKKYSCFVCDICLCKVSNLESIWMDEICNLGFCTECIGVTEILEENVYTFED